MPLFAEAVAPWAALDRVSSSVAVLAGLALLGALAGVLVWFGVVGAALRLVGAGVRGGVRLGFRLWEVLFSAASWQVFLGGAVALTVVGVALAGAAPVVAAGCGAAVLFMGVTACLAYMAVDLERYEVERGYKAVHDPLKGQVLATVLIRHGTTVGVPLLASAAVAVVGGFALLNLGLYGAGGRAWFAVGGDTAEPGFLDFLAYTLVNIYRIVDLLDLSGSYNLPQFTFVRQARWPAATLLAVFKTFFTLVLLQQIFASVRQGQALAEAVADFWSPHVPIHERARNSLPQFGVGMVGPLLASLREVPALTKEQRDQLPRVVAGIGPGAVPTLVEHLTDEHEGVRAVTAAALGRLHALEALPGLAALAADPSELVRQEVAAALGAIGGPGVKADDRRSRVAVKEPTRRPWVFRRREVVVEEADHAGLALAALRALTADASAAVRVAAAEAVGLIGPAAAAIAPALVPLLADADETVRCQAAEALGRVADAATVPALAAELKAPSPAVRAAAARALGAFGPAANAAVEALVRLLQDPEESVRQAAGEAVGRVGPLPDGATASLVEGLTSRDTLVRAQTAEALGAIGEGAIDAAPALAEALTNGTDHVRAKAAEALGKIGETAADVAVPVLVRALRDRDNWVSALAAEALGEMGEAAGEALPALVRSLRHINPLVRANTAEAVGKLGEAGAAARAALEAVAADADGAVRAAALRALGRITPAGDVGPVVLAGLGDADPRARAAAAEAVGVLGEPGGAAADALLPLLDDANDEVKFQVIRALPRLAGAAATDGLCRRLLDDDSVWVREAAAQAIGQLGPGAAAAGPALLRAAQTGEAEVREAAVRAAALVQPPEAADVFTGALADASPEVRKLASAGWMKAASIPESAVPALVDALRDPEAQVRANAAHALARLDELPAAAVPLLEACAADPNDGLRLNAAVALRGNPASLRRLVDDPNARVRLVAAGTVLVADPADAPAAAVVLAALADPAARQRRLGFDVFASLGGGAAAYLDALRERAVAEDDEALRGDLAALVARLRVSD